MFKYIEPASVSNCIITWHPKIYKLDICEIYCKTLPSLSNLIGATNYRYALCLGRSFPNEQFQTLHFDEMQQMWSVEKTTLLMAGQLAP